MFSDFLLLQYDNIPCWYEISFDPDNLCVVMKVCKDYLQHCPMFTPENPMISKFMKELGFETFNGDLAHGDFGFNLSFKRLPEKDNFIIFSVPIPVFEIELFQICPWCQGHKNDLLFGSDCQICQGFGQIKKMAPCWLCHGEEGRKEDCQICNGQGKKVETYMDHATFYAISATFTIFFGAMNFGQEKSKLTSSNYGQLLVVNTATYRGMHGGTLDGVYGVDLVVWLSRFLGNTKILEGQNAMEMVWKKIHGKFDDIDNMNTWMEVRSNGWLSINCPGDRTGLFPSSHWNLPRNGGYEFFCHNVDNPRQQLTLLAALGALCDRVRKEI